MSSLYGLGMELFVADRVAFVLPVYFLGLGGIPVFVEALGSEHAGNLY